MADVLGGVGLIFAVLVSLIMAKGRQPLLLVLFVAFIARASAALLHYYVVPLPDGTIDAVAFERQAWEWGQHGISDALSQYPGIDSYFYSWLMSLLYAMLGRSPLLLQSTSVLAGVLGVFAVWKLTRELWGRNAAQSAAWVMALFPTVVQYSALTMREAWVVVFFVFGLIGVVRWGRENRILPAMGAIASFAAATCFHGGMFVAIIGFLGLNGLRYARQWISGLARGRTLIVSTVMFFGLAGLCVFYVQSEISVHKLGTAQELVSGDRWQFYFESRVFGDARYPEWIQPNNGPDYLWAIPLRGIYLLFSPFPWDLREPAHLIGFVDGLMYFGVVILIWRNRYAIWADRGGRAILLLVGLLALAFGVGTGNFGIALRHRAKLLAALLALSAPRLPRLIVLEKRYMDSHPKRLLL